MTKNSVIIDELSSLLRKGNAHISLDDALKHIPFKQISIRPDNLPYSIWELTEHLRIAQHDIVEFCRDPAYQSPAWPSGYWPENKEPSQKVWKECLRAIRDNREEMIQLLKKSENKLFEPFSWGSGQSLFREALVIADHNAYHCGEIVAVRRVLGIWD